MKAVLGRLLTRIGRRDVTCRVEEDGNVDIAHPAVRIPSIQQISQNGYHRLTAGKWGTILASHSKFGQWKIAHSEKKEIHDAAVHLSRLEHPLGTDGAPDQRGTVDY